MASATDAASERDAASATEQKQAAEHYTLLKARFKVLQEDALALADAYEAACEELRFEHERQTVMVEKLAEIRARRMNMFLRAPENGMMLYMEESKAAMRQRYPMASRREIRRRLQSEWESVSTDEQQVWTARLRTLVLEQRKKTNANKKIVTPSKKAKVRTGSSPRTSSAGASARTSKTATTVKRKAPSSRSSTNPAANSVEMLKKKVKVQVPDKSEDAAPMASRSKPKAKATPMAKVGKIEEATLKPTAGSRPSKKPKVVKATSEETSGESTAAVAAAATPKRKVAKKKEAVADYGAQLIEGSDEPNKKPAKAPRRSPAKPKNTAGLGEKKATTPKKKATPTKKKASSKVLKKTPPKAKKKLTKFNSSDNEDDDDAIDDDDDDDNDEEDAPRFGSKSSRTARDDDSQSSGGGSGSEEDDDEHMAQLPTGAFG